MRRALYRVAGTRLQKALHRTIRSRWHAAAAGCVTATLLQSSSLANLLCVNLIHARWLSLASGLAFMLGANVGTTTTVQLISMNAERALPYLAVVALALGGCGRGRWRWLGAALGGCVTLLAGMDAMSQGLHRLAVGSGPWQAALDGLARHGSGGALLAGALLTGIVQSSSVTIGMAMALASAGALDPARGIAFMLGANVGTVGSTILGALGASRPAQQAAVGDLLFNLLGVLGFWPLLPLLAASVAAWTGDPARQIALAHGIFNGATALVGLVGLEGLAGLARRIVPERQGPG